MNNKEIRYLGDEENIESDGEDSVIHVSNSEDEAEDAKSSESETEDTSSSDTEDDEEVRKITLIYTCQTHQFYMGMRT